MHGILTGLPSSNRRIWGARFLGVRQQARIGPEPAKTRPMATDVRRIPQRHLFIKGKGYAAVLTRSILASLRFAAASARPLDK